MERGHTGRQAGQHARRRWRARAMLELGDYYEERDPTVVRVDGTRDVETTYEDVRGALDGLAAVTGDDAVTGEEP